MASRRKEFFPEVTDEQWNDWHWQVKNRIETLDQLKKYIRLTPDEEEGIRESLKTLRMAITPYYLSLIDPDNPYCPIRKQSVPTIEELTSGSFSLGTTQSECRLGRPVTRRQRFSRTGINSPLSGPGVVPDHRYVFDVLPALYPAPLCRTSRLCHSIGKNR